jgi:hypothetical protein
MTINTQDLLNNELVTLCSDPDTDPAVLCQLADELLQWNPWMRRRDPVGLMALAANPSVPIHKLMDLIRLKPAEVLHNPAFELHLAVNPRILHQLDIRAKVSLVRCEETHPEIIRKLATKRSTPVVVRAAAASNPACPPDLLRSYINGHAWQVRSALARNQCVPRDLLYALSGDKKAQVRNAVAGRRDLPPGLADTLAKPGAHPIIIFTLIRNPSISDNLITRFRHHRSALIRDNIRKKRPHLMRDRREQPDPVF